MKLSIPENFLSTFIFANKWRDACCALDLKKLISLRRLGVNPRSAVVAHAFLAAVAAESLAGTGVKLIPLLIDWGSNPYRLVYYEQRGGVGENAIHLCLRMTPFSPKILRCLLQASGELDQPDRNQRTPLDMAAHAKNFEAMIILLEAGATPVLNLHLGEDPRHPHPESAISFLRSRREKQDLQKVDIPESPRISKRL